MPRKWKGEYYGCFNIEFSAFLYFQQNKTHCVCVHIAHYSSWTQVVFLICEYSNSI